MAKLGILLAVLAVTGAGAAYYIGDCGSCCNSPSEAVAITGDSAIGVAATPAIVAAPAESIPGAPVCEKVSTEPAAQCAEKKACCPEKKACCPEKKPAAEAGSAN
ncbi:MAG: hypothetical protein L0Z55_12135 [Planctomycetes bacterium]|nr:hypothetical protein [Planctomycetota bacterium]